MNDIFNIQFFSTNFHTHTRMECLLKKMRPKKVELELRCVPKQCDNRIVLLKIESIYVLSYVLPEVIHKLV